MVAGVDCVTPSVGEACLYEAHKKKTEFLIL